MKYTETVLEAERVALLEGEKRGDVIAWLSAPTTGVIPTDWDEE